MSFWPFEMETVSDHCAIENFLTSEECEKIIKLGQQKKLNKAITFEGKSPIRESYISWIYPTDDVNWLFEKITDATVQANRRCFNFELTGLGEGLQFTYYTAPKGKYGRHMDSGPKAKVRKLSFTVQLSDENSYKNGNILIHHGDPPLVIPKKQGLICFFPSYMLHEVSKVSEGERYSLVGWITGPSFK